MKILTILGARPQFIKAGSVSREIAKYSDIDEVIVDTGQHYDANMSDIFFNEMKVAKSHYNLNINDVKHGAMFHKNLSSKPNFEIKDSYILSTIHREENTDDQKRLSDIFRALNEIAKGRQIILPLHPQTKKIINKLGINMERLTIIKPVGYVEMVCLIDNCDLVMTDSDVLQKEAFFFKKPCITLGDETEWIELIENSFNVLVGSDKSKIASMYKTYEFNSNFNIDLYGEGNASESIIEELLNYE